MSYVQLRKLPVIVRHAHRILEYLCLEMGTERSEVVAAEFARGIGSALQGLVSIGLRVVHPRVDVARVAHRLQAPETALSADPRCQRICLHLGQCDTDQDVLDTSSQRFAPIGHQNGRASRNLRTCLRSLRSVSAKPRSCHPSTIPAARAMAALDICRSVNSSFATLTSLM